MKTKLFFLSLLTVSSLSVVAEPVYLDCKLNTEKEITSFSVKLDEQSNKITHTYETGSAFNTEGFFTANTVSYKRVQISGSMEFITQYEINREDLSLKYSLNIEPVDKEYLDKVKPINSTNTGSCTIVKQTPKAF